MMHDIDSLFAAARAASLNAHAPYSRFPVGAAIATPSGAVHVGCNVENAAYPLGSCAEAGAIAAMVVSGERRIAAMAIHAERRNPCFPCGGCRQRIREFSDAATLIHVWDTDAGLPMTFRLDDILPHAFGPETLNL